MPDPVELTIRYDGNAPGLEGHRLSLSAFHKALGQLLRALQHTADSIASGREGQPERRRSGKLGLNLDLQIQSIEDGCVTLKCVLVTAAAVMQGASGPPLEGLEEKTAKAFLHSVENEWQTSDPQSRSVQRYLDSLPRGVATQDYVAKKGETVIGTAKLTHEPTEPEEETRILPMTRDFHGRIIGAKFDPRHGRIRIRDAAGEIYNCHASPEVIAAAVAIYRSPVIGKLMFSHGRVRLLTIRAEGEEPCPLNTDERRDYLAIQWDAVLRKLAE